MLSDEILHFLEKHKIKYEEKNGIVFVDGDLDLRYIKLIPKNLCLIVEGNLLLYKLESIPEGFTPTVGKNLYLDRLKSVPSGFNPTVGGDLWLNRLKSIPEGFNPTSGDLYLYGLESINPNWSPKQIKGKIHVSNHLRKDLDYCLEMTQVDSQFDFLPKD